KRWERIAVMHYRTRPGSKIRMETVGKFSRFWPIRTERLKRDGLAAWILKPGTSGKRDRRHKKKTALRAVFSFAKKGKSYASLFSPFDLLIPAEASAIGSGIPTASDFVSGSSSGFSSGVSLT